MMMWCLAWWPHAIAHGLNPFISHEVWAPAGYNLTWSASIPALALAMAPVTVAFGPTVSYNLAALLMPALSGWAAFLLCRHITHSLRAALAGGLLYGFSPYEVGHVLAGHLNLTAIFVPPLCVLLVLLLVEDRICRLAFAIFVALALTIQCLISTEILATMAVFGTAAMLLGIVLMPDRRTRLLVALLPIACAGGAAFFLLAPFLYYAFVQGSAPSAPIFPPAYFSADLASLVVPGKLMLVHTHATAMLASRFKGNIWENGSYLSIPMLLIAGDYFRAHRREPLAHILLVLLLIVAGAALGPLLHVDGRPIITLPWTVLAGAPLVRHALPVRFSAYAFLILAIIASLWLADPRRPFRAALAVAALVALLPNPALLTARSSYDNPAFFANGLYRQYLRPDENILIIPYGMSGPSMAWQAESGMYFRMAGGYLGPTPDEFQQWPIVNTLLTSIPVPQAPAQFRAFAAAHRVEAIAVANGVHGVVAKLPASLGLRPLEAGGLSLYRLPRQAEPDPPTRALNDFQQASAQAWFLQLRCAAHRFLASGHELVDLAPIRSRELDLLPDSKWGESLEQTFAGAAHGAVNGLWIGPGAGGTVAFGMPASSAAVEFLLSRYGRDAANVLYPYPRKYSALSTSGGAVHYLLITLRRDAVHCGP